jgi:plastocyanin
VSAIAALGLVAAGCGGGDENEAAPPAPPAETPPAETGGGGEAAGTTLELAADPSGALAFDKTSLEAPAGEVSIVLTNDSSVPHNVSIEDGGVEVEGETFSGGGTRTTSATLEPGTYTFYCSVPGHADAGMTGTLTVS